jgi:hypothetical protein
VTQWSAAGAASHSFPRPAACEKSQLDCRSDDYNCHETRGRVALARTYLGVSGAAEALGCTQGWLWRLRSEDPDFPTPSVEIHEPRAVFPGWSQRSIQAYGKRRRARGGRPGPAVRSPQAAPAVFIGVNRLAELLDVTRARVLQLRDSDPQFPHAQVKLLERTRVREGYDETAARGYANRRSSRPGRPAKASPAVG